VLVIRAWLETDADERPLRARITQTLDVSRTGTFESAAASEDEVLAAVRDWLHSVVASVTAR
jgi:hypothetical protein